MTAPTPEQMRALANEGDERALDIITRSPGAVHKLTAALRAAADQIEAVHRLSDSWKREGVAPDFWIELNRTLRTADTAPQEDRPAVDWDRFDREVLGDD